MMAHRSTDWGSNGRRTNVEPQQEKSRQVQRLNVQDLVQEWPFDRVARNDSNAEVHIPKDQFGWADSRWPRGHRAFHNAFL